MVDIVSFYSVNYQRDKEEGSGDGHDDFNKYVLSIIGLLAKDSIGIVRASCQVKTLLYIGHNQRITPKEIKKQTGVSLAVCEQACEQYRDEVDLFNSKF